MEVKSRFAIQDWLDFDAKGRAACPSCAQDGKKRQKNLSVKADGKYWCYRGCTPTQIRGSLGAPPPGQPTNLSKLNNRQSLSPSPTQSRTVSEKQVQQASDRLLLGDSAPQQQALAWLEARGFTRETIQHYRLGLDQRWITLDENNPNSREGYWSISIYIPAQEPGQFYKKMRVAPWLVGEARPEYLSNWCQYGVPATIWFTYLPENAEATWYCEGEWDAMRLGWLARQHGAKIAVCCSTGGCGTVPKQDRLDQLPGIVTLFFDRNDEPRKDGKIPGDEGAKKLALALPKRGRIALVPMPDQCAVKGWDVSNALDAGYDWADFLLSAAIAVELPITEARQQNQSPESKVNTQSQSPLSTFTDRAVAAMSLRDKILEILHGYDTLSLREAALMDLAHQSGYAYRDVDKLAKSLAIEVDVAQDQAEAAKKLQHLIKTRCTHLDLNRYLEPWFAETLKATAKAMPTAPEFLFTTLLSAAASRVGTAAKAIVKPSAKYAQPLVFWTAIVANSGSMKTPAQRVILDPLVALETEAYELYQLKLANYRAQKEASKGKKSDTDTPEPSNQPPTRSRYLTKDVTLETLQRIHGENPRGLLYYRDELAANTKARNQYRGGHGADEEAELDQWNGSAILYDRAEKSVCLPRSAISRTGGYQWEVLAQLMNDHSDFNGNFARWLFCAAKAPKRYLHLSREDRDTGISEVLTHLYLELEKVPEQDYLLSYEAQQLLETWQHQLVDAQIAEDACGLQLAFPKIEAYTARLALWLQIVNATLRGEKPSQMISGDTMEKAIELAAYYLWQYRLIHTHNSPDSGLAALGLKVQKFAERSGRVTASALKSGIRALRKMATPSIRQMMQTLADTGYGQIVGEGTQIVYIPSLSDALPPDKNDEDNSACLPCQLVNPAPESDTATEVELVDLGCQSQSQLLTAQPNEVEDDLPSKLENGLIPKLTNTIDKIDTELTTASTTITKTLQASDATDDTIDTLGDCDKNSSTNLVVEGLLATAIPLPSWDGFKVGDLVRLSYHQSSESASVIDPAQYLEMGVQPQPDYIPVWSTNTGQPEWYPAAWVRLAT